MDRLFDVIEEFQIFKVNKTEGGRVIAKGQRWGPPKAEPKAGMPYLKKTCIFRKRESRVARQINRVQWEEETDQPEHSQKSHSP